jgi:hypothetical protein
MQTPPADAADRPAVDVTDTMADRPISFMAAVEKTARDVVLGKVERDMVPGTVEATNGNDLAVDTASAMTAHSTVPMQASNADDRRAEIIEKNDNTSATIVTRGTEITARATTVAKSGNLNVTELVHGIQKDTNLSPDRRQRLGTTLMWTL